MTKLLTKLFHLRTIVNCEHQPYLLRWYVWKTRWFHIMIHKFVRSDEDRALHDHPWNFFVIPLWRGYIEHYDVRCPGGYYDPLEGCPCKGTYRINKTRNVLPLLGIRYRKAEYRHRVELRSGKPAWSLFISFNRRRVWCFWPEGKPVEWNKWWQTNKCDDNG